MVLSVAIKLAWDLVSTPDDIFSVGRTEGGH
jgi:hypothetical protein